MISDKNIIITGTDGFLGGHLYRILKPDNTVTKYNHDIRKPFDQKLLPQSVDMIMHFAAPNDYVDLQDEHKTVTSIIDGTINMLNMSLIYPGSKFVFASSLAVETPKDVDYIYGNCKLAMENYISSTHNNYLILRIPRVYDKSRKKGLMKQLRESTVPEEDYDKKINFLTLTDFLQQTIQHMSCVNSIVSYNNTKTKTIKEISNLYK